MDEITDHTGHDVIYTEVGTHDYSVTVINGKLHIGDIIQRDVDPYVYCYTCDEYVMWEYEDLVGP